MTEKIEFKEEKITKENLLKILEAGRLAPTAKNLQPQRIYVVETEEGLNKLNKIIKYKAPIVLIICGDIENCYKENYYVSYRSDTILVAIHMILEATHLGIDNLWINDLNIIDKVEKEFDLTKNIRPVSLLLLGYKTDDSIPFNATDYNGNILPNQRKEISEIVKYI